MNWIYWVVGLFWIIDGFIYFVFPAFARGMFMRAFEEGRYVAASLGPAMTGVLLWSAAMSSPHAWTLRVLALLSLVQAAYLFRALRGTGPRLIEKIVTFPNRYFRVWGLVLTLLGLFLIGIRPW
ncbi:MAG TPA: hypothetical protein P5079_09360 [Elusimicrobiota bacterium]|nr:hypothetical protein [Elusimicrobiota bacterium]